MDTKELRGKIVARYENIKKFCAAVGFNRSTFDRKLNGESEFDREDMMKIINGLNLSWDEARKIFFNKIVA